MTRTEPQAGDCAVGRRGGAGVASAPFAEADTAAVRRELGRLTALLHRHFNRGDPDSLLPALANARDPDSAALARHFLGQIRSLAQALETGARRWPGSPDLADAFADFRRETLALLEGVEEQLGN